MKLKYAESKIEIKFGVAHILIKKLDLKLIPLSVHVAMQFLKINHH